MATMQPLVARFVGLLKEFTFDDKGSTVVAAFGAPPLAHEDNELRALRVAEALRATLAQRGIGSSIGIATGHALCGLVGSRQRREYSISGNVQAEAWGLIGQAENTLRQQRAKAALPELLRAAKGQAGEACRSRARPLFDQLGIMQAPAGHWSYTCDD